MEGLFIVAVIEVHFPYLRLDVCLLLLSDAVFFVESFIGPCSVPCLHRYPYVGGVRRVLGNLSHRYEESEESRLVV